MNYNPSDFTDFEGPSNMTAQLRSIFEGINPRYSRWLRSATIGDDSIELSYNGNSPTPKSLRREIEPLLQAAGLPGEIEIKIRRPADLHPVGKEFFNKLKKHKSGNSIISDFNWIKEEEYPSLHYLNQYHFIRIEYEHDVLGFDWETNKLWCKRWISRIEITESEGESLLRRWCEGNNANKTMEDND